MSQGVTCLRHIHIVLEARSRKGGGAYKQLLLAVAHPEEEAACETRQHDVRLGNNIACVVSH